MTELYHRKDSPAVQRRSSSAYSQRTSVATRNSLPVSLTPAKAHRSLERKKASGLKYSGSQSTSSIPRRVVKENMEKMKSVNLTLTSETEKGEEEGPGGPVTSILSFVEHFPPDHRKQSLIHGHELELGPSLEKNNAKNENTKKVAGKKKEEIKAVAGVRRSGPVAGGSVKTSKEKRPVRAAGQSVTAPVRTPATARAVKATKSLTGPVSLPSAGGNTKSKVTKSASVPRPAVSKANPAPVTQSKSVAGKKNFPPKKVSSEYPNEILFKNQEGLKFSSVNFFEEEEGATSR